MGGQGVSEYEREALILSSSPGDPLGTFPSLGKYLAAGAAKSPQQISKNGKTARTQTRK